MTPERWNVINKLFQSALDLDPKEQAGFLDEACAGNESLRAQVETLLAADANAGTFIEGNAAGDVEHLLAGENEAGLSGENIQQYEILSILGTGGMGKVYLARDSRLDRRIALKTLPASFSKESEIVKRFETEAKAAAALNHPNVATIYSVEETDENHLFITMEYVEGQTLDELFTVGGIDLRTFLDWFAPLADAFSQAHQKGVIHRDIKPGNIMITSSGSPKILDFGLARIDRAKMERDDPNLSLTRTGQVMGTPAYMAPEQAEGKPSDHRTDIFSFGVVMYEAITGKRPFEGENYASIISNLLTKQPADVAQLRPDVPGLISRLIMKCLEKNPRHRYQSMDEVRVLLSEVRSAMESGTAFFPAANEPGGRASRLRKVGFSVFCVAMLVSGLFGIWSYFFSGNERDFPVTRFSVSAPDGESLGLFHAALAPEGDAIVFAARETPEKQLYLRLLDKDETEPMAGTSDARNPFFSPDGKFVGFFTGEKTLKKIPRDGGNALSICESCSSDSNAHWSRNGLIIGSDHEGLYSVPENGGTPKRLTRIDKNKGEIGHHSPQLLPDGDSVLYAVQNQNLVRFAVHSLKSGKSSDIYRLEGTNTEHGRASFAQYLDSGHLLFSKGKQLLAIAFDLSTLSVRGAPLPILDGLFSVPNFKVANNGTLVFLPEAPTDENLLVWVDRSGNETPVFEKKGSYQSPRLSPDGSKIAVQVDNDIWIYEVADGRGVRLTFEGENQVPLWSADGSAVVYTSKRGNVWSIFKKSVSGSAPPEKLLSSDLRQLPYSWHPTDPIVALATVPAVNNSDIAFFSLEDKKTRSILDSEFKEDTPRFSPDGKWLAYFSTETGGVKVYARSTNDTSKKVPVSKESGMFPVWAHSGREIFYRQGPRMIAVKITTGDNLSVGPSNVLFSGKYLTSFDINADGSKFLMVKNEKGSMPTHLNVVLGWTGEFKELLASK